MLDRTRAGRPTRFFKDWIVPMEPPISIELGKLFPPHLARVPGPLAILDMHTAGEPVRIVLGGYPELAGATILDKRRHAGAEFDHLRRRMMLEPRGHAGMYGVIPVAPSAPGADYAVLFTHNSGYSTMCGHATIAVGRWLADAGLVPMQGGTASFGLECPCGVVQVTVEAPSAQGRKVSFLSVPAFLDQRDVAVPVAGYGNVVCDVAFGGAYYAILSADALGLSFDRDSLPTLVRAAHAVFAGARDKIAVRHPEAEDLSFLYGVILTDDAGPAAADRNVCVFGEGQLDRSPTGSGVTARLARDFARGLVPIGRSRTFLGPTGVPFGGAVHRNVEWQGRSGIVASVSGTAHYSGYGVLLREAADPLDDGFTKLD
jgi:proline racemase